jgi:hypothetical protein
VGGGIALASIAAAVKATNKSKNTVDTMKSSDRGNKNTLRGFAAERVGSKSKEFSLADGPPTSNITNEMSPPTGKHRKSADKYIVEKKKPKNRGEGVFKVYAAAQDGQEELVDDTEVIRGGDYQERRQRVLKEIDNSLRRHPEAVEEGARRARREISDGSTSSPSSGSGSSDKESQQGRPEQMQSILLPNHVPTSQPGSGQNISANSKGTVNDRKSPSSTTTEAKVEGGWWSLWGSKGGDKDGGNTI